MPTALLIGPYRFFFWSNERNEPRHVHVERDRSKAKFWLEPVQLASKNGFGQKEINRIQKLVEENQQLLIRRWNEHFNL